MSNFVYLVCPRLKIPIRNIRGSLFANNLLEETREAIGKKKDTRDTFARQLNCLRIDGGMRAWPILESLLLKRATYFVLIQDGMEWGGGYERLQMLSNIVYLVSPPLRFSSPRNLRAEKSRQSQQPFRKDAGSNWEEEVFTAYTFLEINYPQSETLFLKCPIKGTLS
ncbi:hypothetical protein CDAR_111011 [Caerostris darwini]|uniref:Uncharacterized protein n=1 Tax=Caerostris darwini TaxID=1538125 RepID=A0AAV4SS65_9ARAC|nr:hypothetical protein CDAR_111011 [Caerostris darwini]